MGKLIDWSLDQVGKLPPIPAPFLIGLLILFLFVFPTIRKAWRARIDEPKPFEALPVVQLNASGVYTVLTNIQLSIEEMKLDIKDNSLKLAILDMRLKRRNPNRGRTPKPEDIEGETT